MLDISTSSEAEKRREKSCDYLSREGARERYTIVDVDANERRSECEGEEA